mmetsp:Transcript_21488/g.64282  ORF Transcript_21488/g.64282 Transcript_21488/m.64282 type:complete len:233 (-) Transcript_21488:1-699(-)
MCRWKKGSRTVSTNVSARVSRSVSCASRRPRVRSSDARQTTNGAAKSRMRFLASSHCSRTMLSTSSSRRWAVRYVFQNHWLDPSPRITRNMTPTATALQMSTVPWFFRRQETSYSSSSQYAGHPASRAAASQSGSAASSGSAGVVCSSRAGPGRAISGAPLGAPPSLAAAHASRRLARSLASGILTISPLKYWASVRTASLLTHIPSSQTLLDAGLPCSTGVCLRASNSDTS